MIDDRASWTIRQAYELGKSVELRQQEARPATYADYRTHLRRWDEFWCSRSGTPNSPPVKKIRRQHLEEWREWLRGQVRGKNPDLNINKHLRSVQAILQWCRRQEVIDRTPAIERLRCNSHADKFYLDHAELGRLYEACDLCTWPETDSAGKPLTLPPGSYWQAAIVLYTNYGFRTQELIRWEKDHSALAWKNVSVECETPAQDGHAKNASGWLWYVPEKQRRRKPEPLILPLNPVSRAHLDMIRPMTVDPKSLLFDWPRSGRQLYGQWEALCERAEVRPKRNVATGEQPRYHLRHFRKTCTTLLNRHRPGVAPLITGHASRELTGQIKADTTLSSAVSDGSLSKVSADHYDNQELAVQEALLTLPQPAAFLRILQCDKADGPWANA